MSRRLAPHVGIIALTFALALAGLLLLSYNTHQQVAYAAVSADEHLDIARINSTAWGKTAGAAWTLTDAAPGDSVAGGVMLRTTGDAPLGGGGLRISAVSPTGATPPLAGQFLITEMHLGGQDLLPYWAGACTASGRLSLGTLMYCAALPALPLPGPNGQLFTMTITLDPAAGNAYQGGSADNVIFEFSLDQSDIVPPSTTSTIVVTGTATPTATPSSTATTSPSNTPTTHAPNTASPTGTSPAHSASASPGQPGTPATPSRTNGSTAAPVTTTPLAPNSGSGTVSHHTLGATLLGLALLLASGWTAAVIAIRRRPR